MQKIFLTAPMFRIEISGEHETELFRAAAFWLSLPNKCPKCQRPLILNYRTPQVYVYYELKCTGNPSHSINLGESKNSHNLYYDPRKEWKTYDAGHIEPDDKAALPPATTPDPALSARERSEPTERPPTEAERKADAAAADSAGMANSRNDLINLITECKRRDIPPGIGVGDVRDMNGPRLVDEAKRLRALIETQGRAGK